MAAYGENLTSVDAFSWVPRGYAVVRVDERGTGGTRGPLQLFSRQEALDYYDVIEWVAAQDWCTGAVGLAAASYGATIQWNVARLRPPSLRAMIPWASDIDSYRELAYPGGILHEGYRNWWWGSVTPNITPGEVEPDFVQALREHPLYDESFYGPDGDGPITAALDEIDLPFLTAVSQNATLHARGGFEAFRECPSPDKRLLVVDSHYYPFFFEWCLDDLVAFFDRWLKDDEAALADRPRVRYALLTGHGEFTWRDAPTWPPPGAEQLVLHLDASTGGARHDHRARTRRPRTPPTTRTRHVRGSRSSRRRSSPTCCSSDTSRPTSRCRRPRTTPTCSCRSTSSTPTASRSRSTSGEIPAHRSPRAASRRRTGHSTPSGRVPIARGTGTVWTTSSRCSPVCRPSWPSSSPRSAWRSPPAAGCASTSSRSRDRAASRTRCGAPATWPGRST